MLDSFGFSEIPAAIIVFLNEFPAVIYELQFLFFCFSYLTYVSFLLDVTIDLRACMLLNSYYGESHTSYWMNNEKVRGSRNSVL
jgi:hypothetical protein